MKIAYLNAHLIKNSYSGGSTHIREFIQNAAKLGHTIYIEQDHRSPFAEPMPKNVFAKISTFMGTDVHYTRYEGEVSKKILFSKYPRRAFLGNALNVWEFNTIPEFALHKGHDQSEVTRQIKLLNDEAQCSELAVCVSDKMAQYVKSVLNWERVITVTNGSNPDHFKPGLPVPPRMTYFKDYFNVVWSGSLKMAWNNTEILKDSALKLWRSGKKDIHFHLIGDFLPDFAKDLPPNVSLYGQQPYDELPHWLSAMDVGLILYNDKISGYGSPIKFFDYLSSGLAVISTDHPQVRDILASIGEDQFVLKSTTSDALSELILILHDHKNKLSAFKHKAIELIVTQYNWSENVSKILSELENLLERPHSKG